MLRRLSVVAIVAVVFSLFGAGLMSVLMSSGVPDVLQSGSRVTVLPVSERVLDDSRSVALVVEMGESLVLRSGSEGTVTSVSVTPGSVVGSGDRVFEVEGRGVVALASASPLWRDLLKGDKGDDVRVLQRALVDVGYEIAVDGEVGDETLRAVADLQGITSESGVRDFVSILPGMFLWLPAKSVTVGKVRVGVGQKIAAGDETLDLDGGVRSISVAQVPLDLIDAEHVLVFDEQEFAVDTSGTLVDPSDQDLALIRQTQVFKEWEKTTGENKGQLSVPLRLKTGIKAFSVSPSVIYGIDADMGCVSDGQRSYKVKIVGSELGQTYVQFDDGVEVPQVLSTQVGAAPSCM